jgi:hypothetical protein
MKTLDTHIRDLERMDHQAERIYKSITDLLDLKQKHANAFEARFARDQAAGTARQSQTIMVFTIVTIIFLPLSFISSFFAINIREFPHEPGGDEPSLQLSWVSKYMFGIGLAISIPFIVIALSFDAIGDFFREVRRRYRDRQIRGAGARHALVDEDKFVYADDMQHTFTAGRSTFQADGRPSVESYLSRGYTGGRASLLPVASQGSGRSGEKGDVKGVNGVSKVNGRLSVEVKTSPVERLTTGFRMRGSGDVERGA